MMKLNKPSIVLLIILFAFMISCESKPEKNNDLIENEASGFDVFSVFDKKKFIKNLSDKEEIAFEIGYTTFVNSFMNRPLSSKIDNSLSEATGINVFGLQKEYLHSIFNKENYYIFKIEYSILDKYDLELFLISCPFYLEDLLIAIDDNDTYYTLYGFEHNQSLKLISSKLIKNDYHDRKKDSLVLYELFNYNAMVFAF